MHSALRNPTVLAALCLAGGSFAALRSAPVAAAPSFASWCHPAALTTEALRSTVAAIVESVEDDYDVTGCAAVAAKAADVTQLTAHVGEIDFRPFLSFPKLRVARFWADSWPEATFATLAPLAPSLEEVVFGCWNEACPIAIEGIELLTRLTRLVIDHARVASLEPLLSLPALRDLDLSDNGLSSFGVVARLPALERLSITENRISDLTPLHTMTGLRELYLRNNPVDDLTPLMSLLNLKTLELSRDQLVGAPLKGVWAVRYMANLTRLRLEAMAVTEIAALGELPWLRELDLRKNSGVGDWAPLSRATRLTWLCVAETNAPTEVLRPLTKLDTLVMTDAGVTTVEPLGAMTELRTLHLDNNRITSLAPLAALSSLVELNACGNPLERRVCPREGLTTCVVDEEC